VESFEYTVVYLHSPNTSSWCAALLSTGTLYICLLSYSFGIIVMAGVCEWEVLVTGLAIAAVSPCYGNVTAVLLPCCLLGPKDREWQEAAEHCIMRSFITCTLRLISSFFDIGIRWRSVVSFTPRSLYPQRKSPWYPLDRRLGEPQSRSGRGGEEKNSQSPPGIEL
jgi:hypothetical protein